MEGKNEIFTQRLIRAVIWNIVLQTFLAIALVFIIEIDLLQPISWIVSTFHVVLSWKMGLNIVLLALVSLFQAYIYSNYYMAPMPKYFSRFSMFFSMFTFQNMTFSILYALSGYFTMGLYSSLAQSNLNMLKKKCEQFDGQCLMEKSLFLEFGGMWMGLYYFLNVHVFGTASLIFPHIYQDKYQQIRLAINGILPVGFRTAVMPVLYYCLFYYFWGNKPRSVVSNLYSLYLEDPPLDNVFNLVSSGIFIGLWFYASLFFTSIYGMRTVFHIVLTEPMKFSIEPSQHSYGLSLHNALAQKSQFNGYLAAQDFKRMAVTDYERRAEIFTLSLPGGHPRIWNDLLQKCLYIINNFNKELEIINGDVKPNETDNSSNQGVIFSPASGNLRNMAQSPELHALKEHRYNKEEDNLTEIAKKEFTNYLHKLCQKPGLNYFFGELTDTKLKYILMQVQPVIWTCEGLAYIASASLREDKYGIIQNDLPVIITALINLKHNIDKLTKLGLMPRKHILNDAFAIKMKTAVTSSLKRSIYKIVVTFEKYIHEIPLSPDIQLSLQPFVMWKEP